MVTSSMNKAAAYSKKSGEKPFARLHAKRQKEFDIKRDKGGEGFTMMIRKKIKGFEEETGLDEAEGIRTVSTKGYSGSKLTKPSNRKSTKGYINFKAGKPASDNDQKILDWHKSEAAKEGKVTQLRYRGPRSHAGRHTYNPGASQIRGAATGAAIYYKDKSELGGRQRHAEWYKKSKANEEIEMPKDQLDETSKEKAKAYLRQAPGDLAQQEWATGSKYERGERDDMKRHARKGKNRIEGIRRAVKKVSEESEVDEGKSDYYTDPDRDDRRSERGPPDDERRQKQKDKKYGKEPYWRAETGRPEKDLRAEKRKSVKEETEGNRADPSSQNPWQWAQYRKLTKKLAARDKRDDERAERKRNGEGRSPGIEGATGHYGGRNEETELVTELSDLVIHAIDQKPLDFQQSFADLMQQRIEDAVHEKKLEIAAGFAGANTDLEDSGDEEGEPVEDDDWDGTEYEPEDEDLEPGEPHEGSPLGDEPGGF